MQIKTLQRHCRDAVFGVRYFLDRLDQHGPMILRTDHQSEHLLGNNCYIMCDGKLHNADVDVKRAG